MCIRDRDRVWRKRNHNELYAKYNDITVVLFAKINRLRWVEHVQRMDDERKAKRIMKHKPIGKRKFGRPKNRWLDQVGSDARKLRCLLYTSVPAAALTVRAV